MQQKVHIKDIHVPLLLMLTFIVAILGGASTLAFGWYTLTEHAGDHEIQHPPIKDAVAGGGIAFKADVEAAETRMRQALRDSNKATRKMLMKQTITCTRTQRGLGCTVTVPEE